MNLGYDVTLEPKIKDGRFRSRGSMHMPDLKVSRQLFNDRPNIIFGCFIELDGPYHGSMDMVSESKQTLERNTDYEIAHYRYIVINEELARNFNLDFNDLTAYRVMEEESKFRARLNGGLMFL